MDRKLWIALFSLLFLLGLGTWVYHRFEGWSYIDSLYFTTITLTTIGYGDLFPTHPGTRLFTVFFALTGVAIALYSLTLIGSEYFSRREKELILALENKKLQAPNLQNLKIIRADRHVADVLKKIDQHLRK